MIIYDKESWTFMKGAMETIDRTYGFGLDSITHNITNGHLVHHVFFTQIPHYNLIEARNIIKPFLGDWYKVEDQNWLLEFLRDHFVLTRRAVFENGVDYVYKRAFSSWSEVNEFLGFSKKFN